MIRREFFKSVAALLHPGVSYLPRAMVEKSDIEKLKAINEGKWWRALLVHHHHLEEKCDAGETK